MLVLALVISTVFVVLSAWQFDQSTTDQDQLPEHSEEPVALTEIFEPARAITAHEADSIVDLSGEFVADTQVMVADRIHNDEVGYWAVAAFRMEGAPHDQVIPVVRGWSEDYDDVAEPPTAELDLQGRLLPTEAPGSAPRDEPAGVLPSLSVAELINLWGEDSYSGFVVDFSEQALGDSDLEPVWVDPQPEEEEVNWLNLFYGLEWFVFAGFAFYLWWRLVKDAHLRELEEERLDREWEEQWRREQLAKLQTKPDGNDSQTEEEPKDPPRD